MTDQARMDGKASRAGWKTPETDPDHWVIGKWVKGWDGHHYYVDAWQPNAGFWVTRADAPFDRWEDQHSEYRRNISERAIDRTFHRVWSDKLIGELTAQRSAAQPKP